MRQLRVGFHGVLTACLILTGCCCGGREGTSETEVPALPSHVPCASDRTTMGMQKRLKRQGARVITVGQDYLVSIPSHVLFANQSPRLTWKSYAVLNDVACYLKGFRKVAITITGVSSRHVNTQREHALTLARTREVGNYLWSQGVESRFLFTQGVGSDKPIYRFSQPCDQSFNSRIEITFRDTVA